MRLYGRGPSREVALSHGDDAEQGQVLKKAAEGAEPDSGVRNPDARPVPAAAEEAAGLIPQQRSDDGSVDHSRASNSGGDAVADTDDSSDTPEQNALEALRIQLESAWSGPLPQPAVLAQYDLLLPGAAERILAMAETVATGHIKTADKYAVAEIEQAKLGQLMAFSLTIVAFITAIVFFVLGKTWAGSAFISFPAIMLIRTFVTRS